VLICSLASLVNDGEAFFLLKARLASARALEGGDRMDADAHSDRCFHDYWIDLIAIRPIEPGLCLRAYLPISP